MRGLKYKIITVLAVFVMPFCAEVSGQSFNTLNPGMGDFNDMNFQTPGGIRIPEALIPYTGFDIIK